VFDTVEPNDVEQGSIGVCYFLSALSAIAEFPSRIISLFITKKTTRAGAYCVRFTVKGLPKEVIIDDYFPCHEEQDDEGNEELELIFSRPKGAELWVLLLEKAWAKLYGDYIVTEVGFMDEAFEYILG